MENARQLPRNTSRPVNFGVYEFDPDTLELKRAGLPVRLQELPARLLAALVRQPGELVTREQLRTELWSSNTFVQFDAGLNTAMTKLRLALRDSADFPQYIETVPKTGYRFVAPVRSPDGAKETPVLPAVVPAAEIAPPAVRRWDSTRLRVAGKLLIAAVLILVAAVGSIVFLGHRNSGPSVHYAIDLPPGQSFDYYSGRQVAISPDGETVAWIAVSGGVRQIYIRKLRQKDFHALPGTAGANGMCFSPDGAWIAYISLAGDLGIASIDGRWSPKLARLGPRSIDGTLLWAATGWIYFSATDYPGKQPPDQRGIYRIRPEGGVPEPVSTGPQPNGISYPAQMLPQGMLFTTDYAPPDIATNFLNSADGKVRQVLPRASGAHYLDGGYLIFNRSGNIMAARFDASEMKMTGEPVMLERDVAPDRYAGLQMDVSKNGTLVFFRAPIVRVRQPVWVDKEGHESPASLKPGRYHLHDISRDGQSVLLTRYDAGDHWELGVYRFADGDWKVLRSDDSPAAGALWSPDGKTVAITAHYQGEHFDTIYLKQLNSSEAARPLFSDSYSGKFPQSWSQAAGALAYTEGYHEQTKRDLYVLPLAQGSSPQCVACTPEDDVFPSFSPNGRWLAYTSGVSGHFEVYVQRYPGPFHPVKVSADGGMIPLWAPSGDELYYKWRNDEWALPFNPASGKAGKPRRLFTGSFDAGSSMWNRDMLLSPDGSRFLMLKREPDPPDYRRIQVVTNWYSDIRKALK